MQEKRRCYAMINEILEPGMSNHNIPLIEDAYMGAGVYLFVQPNSMFIMHF